MVVKSEERGVYCVNIDRPSNRLMVTGYVDPDKEEDTLLKEEEDESLSKVVEDESLLEEEEDESLSEEEEDESLSEEEEDENLSKEEEHELLYSELSWREALQWAASIAGFVVLNSR
ncbi:hypothetical protein TSUD_285440 [Trifolium subterraneum]|uniref:Uncharacterized protein n=1 Tax=Trifolium subterraneum TaxID=3900 RepID=A0A2Z6P5N0_TRISU|nr:hypothetical protein TSUD_285440 [Trifolium subterraneum]